MLQRLKDGWLDMLTWCVAAIGLALVYTVCVGYVSTAHSTWQPEYSKNPEAVQRWFKKAEVKGWSKLGQKSPAYQRLKIALCCEKAERLRTKFVGVKGGEWSYYPNPLCVVKGCTLLPIPDDIVHEEEIHALPGDDDTLPEFDEMRKEGVLFIYHDQPSCFWPPTEAGG